MAYRNANYGRRHTDGKGNVTFVPYGTNSNSNPSGGSVIPPVDPLAFGTPNPTPLTPASIQPVGLGDDRRLLGENPGLARYRSFLMDQGMNGDPIYNPDTIGGHRVDRSQSGFNQPAKIILNTPQELAQAQGLSEADSRWSRMNIRAAQDMISRGRSDLANEFLFNVENLNAERGTSHEGRLQYYLNKMRQKSKEISNPSNGFST